MKCGYCNGTGEHINDANRMTTCEFCGGTGEVEVVGDSVTDVCDKCGGTGFFCEMRMGDFCTLGSPCPHQKPLTNEEWLHTLNTEQLAGFLADKCNEVVETVLSDASCDIGDIDNDDYWYRQADFVEWLKEKHND